MKIELTPIGTIHTPFTNRKKMPIQPAGGSGTEGTVTVFDNYRAGLQDLDGFSHIILLYYFHLSTDYSLTVIPFMDTVPRGLFSTRAIVTGFWNCKIAIDEDIASPVGLLIDDEVRVAINDVVLNRLAGPEGSEGGGLRT